MAQLASLSSESSFSGAATDASSNVASFSSTPPTTVSPDSMSLASEPDVPKPDATTAPVLDAVIPLLEDEQKQQEQNERRESDPQSPVGQAIVVAEDPAPTELPPTGRARRTRASLPVYNLSKLSGTYKSGAGKRRRTVAGDDLTAEDGATKTEQAVQNGSDALNPDASLAGPSTPRSARIAKKAQQQAAATQITRRATRLSGAPAETLTTKLATLGKRGKKSFEKQLSRMSRELRRLQDTNEFAHIDTRPVRYTVWANGKYVDVDAEPTEPPRKKTKVDEPSATADSNKAKSDEATKPEEGPATKKRRVKKWLDRGLYAGQETPIDISKGLTTAEKKKLATLPGLVPTGKTNKTFPAPMFNGLRLLINGRDFKLPFDVCNPLPPGQPKPAAYRTMTKSKFYSTSM